MRRFTVTVALTAVVLALTTGTAAAADIAVVPETVPVAGDTEFMLTLTGFTPATPVFVVPCDMPASGDPDDIDGATCRTDDVVSARTGGWGRARITATWTVPPTGLALVAGNEARTEAATMLITVEETRVLGTAQDNPDDELADTGFEDVILAGIGLTLLAAGVVSHQAGLSIGNLVTARRRSSA